MIKTDVIIGFFKAALLAAFLSACSSSPSPNSYANKPLSEYEQSQRTAYLHFYGKWQGVPYRLGGTSYRGIDCSALVQIAYQDAVNLPLPRTTALQSKVGVEIDYDEARVGDLFFFKTSRTTRHVGIYLGNKQFMHASTSKGVVISRIDNPYWADVFWQIRRVDPRL
ncbi:NlpC/P60 family protein [Vibrio panuliri]|uniref:Hydrolase n=1 Tax=Vibrio panuliri TaxID=1381081 RepID=A0ABX3FD98_9VIBR|nr:NlpC/P60 family protein [Vibrio panuliri]KAB1454354.1 hydrolase [Vibrio panuliri]OLQ87824.1 hydrolase [Vibrio panuliri]